MVCLVRLLLLVVPLSNGRKCSAHPLRELQILWSGGLDQTYLKKTFKLSGCSEEQKVPFATFMLEGEATFWWERVERLLLVGGEEPVLWKVFLEVFYEKNFPVSVRHQKEAEFLELIHGNMFVAAYKAKFIELARFTPHIADEPTRARNFLRGLSLEIRTRLMPFLLT